MSSGSRLRARFITRSITRSTSRLTARLAAVTGAAVLSTSVLALGLAAPAQAAITPVFTSTFEDCVKPTPLPSLPDLPNAGNTIRVDLFATNGTSFAACGWTGAAEAWLTVYRSGTAFPSPTQAVWLNEGGGGGSLSRTVTGLTTGKQYRVSVVAWTDNIDAATALGFDAGPVSLNLPMTAGSGQQNLSTLFCAADPSIGLRLFENGSSGSSPVIDNVAVEDMGVYCALTADDDEASTPAGEPVTVDVAANDTATGGVPVPDDSEITVLPGTYAGDATVEDGVLRYSPAVSETGTTVTVPYRICPPGGTDTPPCATANALVTVTAPPAPVAEDLVSVGGGTALQQVDVEVPTDGAVTLLDAADVPVLQVTTPAGTYLLDPDAGTITFTPVLGFLGDAPAVRYRLTDSFSRSDTGTYTPTVKLPAAPAPAPVTSQGVGTAVQTATIDLSAIPPGGSVSFTDRSGNPATSPYNEFSGAGVFTFDAATGTFTYTPAFGISGEVFYPAGYRITDAYGQSEWATYTPTVVVPPGPTPQPLTSEGPENFAQSVILELPAASELSGVILLDADDVPTTTVDVEGGSYDLDPQTGLLTFTPDADYSGTPTPVTYRVTDAYGTPAASTYSPVVVAGPESATITSTGVGTAPQSATAAIPAGGSVALVRDGVAVAGYTEVGEGTYTFDAATGVITFVPELGFLGSPNPAVIVATDRFGQTGPISYVPTVTPPAGPTATDVASTGVGVTPQTVTVPVPLGGAAGLVGKDEKGEPGVFAAVIVPGQGAYVVDPLTGVITFISELGFVGTPEPAVFVLIDAYLQVAAGTYSPTVLIPPAPVVSDLTTTGIGSAAQSVTVSIPPGGSIRLLDGEAVVTEVVVAGQGTYSLDPATGVITFTPVTSFSGTASPVTFQVLDAYGSVGTGTYTAVVAVLLPPAPPPAPPAPLPAPPVPVLAYTGTHLEDVLTVALVALLSGLAIVVGGRRRGRAR